MGFCDRGKFHYGEWGETNRNRFLLLEVGQYEFWTWPHEVAQYEFWTWPNSLKE
jgi:hypothetical protein